MIICVTIEEQTINPTNEQAQASVRVCQMLSNRYRNVQLFRFNEFKGYIFILAGDNIQIMIFPSGEWKFINET